MVGVNAASIVGEAMESEEAAIRMRERMGGEVLRPITKDQALTILLHLKMSSNQYSELRLMFNAATNSRFLPHYETVARHKKVCRPENPLNVTEVLGQVELKNLLRHTVQRMVLAKEANIHEICNDSEITNCTLFATFGMDSATGQKTYKQNFADPVNSNRSDNSLFAVTLNPIRLTTRNGDHLWINLYPASPLFVRPILLEYEKETPDYVRRIDEQLNRDISLLEPIEVETSRNVRLRVNFRLYETQVDGKVFNILTNTNSQSCPCCEAPRHELNAIENLGTRLFDPKGRGLDFGPQGMHALIKFLRLLLNVTYQLPEHREGEIITDVQQSRLSRKRIMKERFKTELKLRIEEPAPGGSGSCMDGNTSRRAFKDPEKLARILELDVDLVKRFKNILMAVNNTQYKLHPEIFQEYAEDTYRLYVRLYGWMNMSPSVHKVLVHAGQMQQVLDLPIGAASESSSELCHRIRKEVRRSFTRKTSRLHQHIDLFGRCMDLSDPVISEAAVKFCDKYRAREELTPEVLALLDTNVPPGRGRRVKRTRTLPPAEPVNDERPPRPENFPEEFELDDDDLGNMNVFDMGDDTDYED